MIKKYIPYVIAAAGIVSAILVSRKSSAPPVEKTPYVSPAVNPYDHAVSASGIIEASRENIAIGSPVQGVIEKVYVNVWQKVDKGMPLFEIDGRDLKAELALKNSLVNIAKAQLAKVKDQLHLLQSIDDPRAVSLDELRTKENEVAVAQTQLDHARADLDYKQALLDRHIVRAPCDGVIIQCNARAGELLTFTNASPIILGDISSLQIRADVDEQNACQVASGANAIAYLKNKPEFSLPLTFVRIEPYVIPKRSLTGQSDERVDTRVLQVIFSFNPPEAFPVYIGQRVDVMIEAAPKTTP
jgi:RND family efflux transporter MFP subunit